MGGIVKKTPPLEPNEELCKLLLGIIQQLAQPTLIFFILSQHSKQSI